MFSGPLHFFDGEPATAWGDYRDFQLRIVDTNDTDDNGIPDIVQLPEPSIVSLQLTTVLALLALRRRPSRAGREASQREHGS